MQIQIENLGQLARKMTVHVPSEQIDGKVTNRLRELSRTVKLHGFRPGKVPFPIIEQKFALPARQEVVETTIKETLPNALKEHALSPVSPPVLTDLKSEQGAALEYIVTFEVFPKIELQPLEKISIEKPLASVTDAALEATIQKIRKAQAEWNEASRPTREGDKAVISFKGSLNGQVREELTAKEATVEIGSGDYFADFEQALIGLEKGAEKDFSVIFPEKHSHQDFAGKQGDFHVTVHQVLEAKLPEFDADFYKKIELEDGTPEKLKAEVSKQLEDELQQKIKQRIKDQMMREVLKLHPLELPAELLARELHRLEHQHLPKHEHGKQEGECKTEALPEALRARLKQQAKENVALSLIFREIIKEHQIEVPSERVDATIDRYAQTFGQYADQIKKMVYEDKNRLGEMESHVLEELIVEKILEKATITEKQYSYDEVMAHLA